MQERYERVFEHESDLYAKDFPIAIIAGAMLKDTATGNVLAQLKLRNIGEKNVIACKVSVRAFESNGTEVEGVGEYSYLDIYATPGYDFGDKNPIYLPDAKARSFKARVTEVVFEDNTVMKAPSGEWKQVEPPRLIEDLIGDAELVKQFKLETGDDCKFIPEKKEGLFRCSCGAFSLETDNGCCKCGRSYVDLVANLDTKILSEKAGERIIKEKEIREANEKQKIKNKKRGIVAVICVLILVLMLFGVKQVIKRYQINKANQLVYDSALDSIKNGEYEAAYDRLLGIKGFSDVDEMLTKFDFAPMGYSTRTNVDIDYSLEYDASGKLISIYGSSEGTKYKNWRKHEFEYDASGKIKEITSTTYYGAANKKYVDAHTTFDSNGNAELRIHTVLFNGSEANDLGEVVKKLSFDSNGFPVSSEVVDAKNGKLITTEKYDNVYDEDGKIEKLTVEQNNLKQPREYTFTYDDKDALLGINLQSEGGQALNPKAIGYDTKMTDEELAQRRFLSLIELYEMYTVVNN